MTANLDFVVGRYHERPFAVCEQTRMMASTLSDSVSSIVGSLSGNLGRTRRCLRAEADRKSVVEGKSVSVSVDLGGRRIITKKNNTTTCTQLIQRHEYTT